MIDELERLAALNPGSIYAEPEREQGALDFDAPEPKPIPEPTPPTQEPEPMNEPTRNGNRPPQTVSETFPSPWLRATDITKPYLVRIVQAEPVEVHNKMTNEKLWRPALAFEIIKADTGEVLTKASKRLLCNKTQCEQLTQIARSERFSDWQGVRCTLSPATAPNGRATIGIAPPPQSAAIVAD
ncbi:MAG: hypothetical protein J5I90_06460 [Caldilineales bacterium]|nr:hypothetical protein [Caldilineales bacterium]